jgi:hypothetical protein
VVLDVAERLRQDDRRLLSLRLDDAPIKVCLKQFLDINRCLIGACKLNNSNKSVYGQS